MVHNRVNVLNVMNSKLYVMCILERKNQAKTIRFHFRPGTAAAGLRAGVTGASRTAGAQLLREWGEGVAAV